MICWRCGKNIPNDAQFCTYCGNAIHPLQKEEQKANTQNQQQNSNQPYSSSPQQQADPIVIPNYGVSNFTLFLSSLFIPTLIQLILANIIPFILRNESAFEIFGDLYDAGSDGAQLFYKIMAMPERTQAILSWLFLAGLALFVTTLVYWVFRLRSRFIILAFIFVRIIIIVVGMLCFVFLVPVNIIYIICIILSIFKCVLLVISLVAFIRRQSSKTL